MIYFADKLSNNFVKSVCLQEEGFFSFSKEENAEAAKLSIPFLKLATGFFKRQAKMFEMPKRHYSWLCYPVIPV